MAGYPLDTVKVKIQTQEVRTGGLKYKGTLDCLIKLVKKDGVSGRQVSAGVFSFDSSEGEVALQRDEFSPARSGWD